jgi:Tol biopolymer transport system component
MAFTLVAALVALTAPPVGAAPGFVQKVDNGPFSYRLYNYNGRPGVDPLLASKWNVSETGTLATVTNSVDGCPVLVSGRKSFRTHGVPDTVGLGSLSCDSGTALKNASNDAKSKRIAFQANFPIGGNAASYDHPQVFLLTGKNLTALTDWDDDGWSAATPTISADGKSIVFAGTGNPTGDNPLNDWQIFAYDVQSRSTTQITTMTGCPSGNDSAAVGPAVSRNGGRIVFISRCDFTGENEFGEQRAFVYDRVLDDFTQLAECSSSFCSSQSPAISADGSTVVHYDVDYPRYYLMTHTLDASLNETRTGQYLALTDAGFDGYVLGTGTAVPDVSADGRRILFTGRINFMNQNPGNWMQVMVLDDVAGGGLRYVTDITDGAAWGGTMTDDGRDIWLLTNAPWKGKTGLHKVKVAPIPN